jgi:menaquinol-cytochrome c reductase iron-sulfur subunit
METPNDAALGEEKPTRRGFAYAVIYGLGGLIGAALTIPAALYLLIPTRSRSQASWVEAGDLNELQPGVPQEMTFSRVLTDGWKVNTDKGTAWVVKNTAGNVTAFAPYCTHLGCAYHWDAAKSEFICPCHTSGFSIDGKVLSGPAPRPLDRYEVKVENARLWLGPIHKNGESS